MPLLPIKQLILAATQLQLRRTVRGIIIWSFGLVTASLGVLMPPPFPVIFVSVGLIAIIVGFVGAAFTRD